jgi:hypothetical protein
MTKKKYMLDKTDKIRKNGKTLYRIVALRDFGDVKAGDKGGYIRKESNLSQEGDCWVYDGAYVFDNAHVNTYARVRDQAVVSGEAVVGDCGGVRGGSDLRTCECIRQGYCTWHCEHIWVGSCVGES